MDYDDLLRKQREWDERARKAQAAASQAYARLLDMAQRGDSGQMRRVARFIAATYNGELFPLDVFELRAVDVEISDDMLVCLDALRWGKLDLHHLVPDGDHRVKELLKAWGIEGPKE